MRNRRDLTERELLVMRAIWNIKGIVTNDKIIQTFKACYGETLTPQSVTVFISNLGRKGYLRLTEVKNGVRQYEPLVTSEEYMKKFIEKSVNFWGKSTVDYAIMALGNKKRMSREEAKKMRDFLDDFD